jgi:hypothetical protein
MGPYPKYTAHEDEILNGVYRKIHKFYIENKNCTRLPEDLLSNNEKTMLSNHARKLPKHIASKYLEGTNKDYSSFNNVPLKLKDDLKIIQHLITYKESDKKT